MKELRNLRDLLISAVDLCGLAWLIARLHQNHGITLDNTVDIESIDVAMFFSGLSVSAKRKAIERLCTAIEQDMLTAATLSSSTPPRIRDIATIHRRLFAADMLIRTVNSTTSLRHIHYVLRNASYPEHGPLRMYAAGIAMLEASYVGDVHARQRYANLVMNLHAETMIFHQVQSITCALRSYATRQSVRSPQRQLQPLLEEAKLIVAARVSSYSDAAIIEIARLAAIYCQFASDYQHGTRWMKAQERAYQRLGLWNSSTMRENFSLRFSVEVNDTDHQAALDTAFRLLDIEKAGSTPWYNLIDSTSGILTRSNALVQAASLITSGFESPNYRRIHISLRRRLLYKSGYLAVLTNSEPLWSTYERRRRMDRITPSRFFHHRVIDILRMLQQHNPDVVEATQNLASQLQRIPPSARPKGVKEFIDVIRSAHAKRSVQRARTSELDQAERIEELVPWPILVAYATAAVAAPTISQQKGRRQRVRAATQA